MKTFFCFTCLVIQLLYIVPVSSQTYNFNLKDDKLEFLTSLGTNVGIHLYDHFRPGEYFDDYDELDRNLLWSIDRPALYNSSSQADKWSDVALYTSILSPLGLYLSKTARQNQLGNIFFMGLQGFLAQDAMTQSFKMMAERPRPYMYNLSEEVLLQRSNKNDTKSFYSGHTSTSAYFTFFSAKIISDLHPESKWLPLYWGLGAAIPAVTGYLRYRAGKHFATDVIVGYVIGAGCGLLVPTLYQNQNLNLQITPGGFHFSARM